ncbi:hypothetical protein GCM10023149_25650 [Mucilaginibacter gynuensis]|uniref:M23ase beta-sheet core domain-containing protein n=1 Tax=Mucilaginibacter gynuensis TaxID=1302236 RepID=A0ABP8GH23_9SPHI
MKTKLIILITFLSISAQAIAQDATTICKQIDQLNTDVLNNIISKKAAATQFAPLILKLKAAPTVAVKHTSWVFPLQGYGASAIGGYKGNGYSAKGYSYFDGNKHSAHPAHDIFIKDKNQDGIDDNTHQPVNVLAVDDGIVIACSNVWSPESTLRGGKYIWVYHPQQNIISYYAHNNAIFVKPGDVVKQGQKIAEVGRTGLNAYKKRSPTHLHFSAFGLNNKFPEPFNPYQQLISSKRS